MMSNCIYKNLKTSNKLAQWTQDKMVASLTSELSMDSEARVGSLDGLLYLMK